MLIDGVILLWFLLTALSVAFVAIDIRTTPEHPVMKWAFVLFTLYSGPFDAFLSVFLRFPAIDLQIPVGRQKAARAYAQLH